MICILLILYILQVSLSISGNNERDLEFCDLQTKQCPEVNSYLPVKYILYDVNPPEGFNLRRDVYLRMAIFAKHLIRHKDFKHYKLVLPPWGKLYHWKSRDIKNQDVIPWGNFFDVESMQRYAPVVEMTDFLNDSTLTEDETIFIEVYILRHYEDMFKSGDFKDKLDIEECSNNVIGNVHFWGYDNVFAKSVKCLLFQGPARQLMKLLRKSNARSVMFEHAEIALHDSWGSTDYWMARRSMQFNKHLIKIAADYRQKHFGSNNTIDNITIPEDWQDEKATRTAVGGNYISVHLRRADFVWGRAKHIPSIQQAAQQIKSVLEHIKTRNVFISTDATADEFKALEQILIPAYGVFKYTPDKETKQRIKDGGVAIVDQIICSHAMYFIGTYESTFSFRIQEEREIMGFPISTTFNRFCGADDSEPDCAKSTEWTITF